MNSTSKISSNSQESNTALEEKVLSVNLPLRRKLIDHLNSLVDSNLEDLDVTLTKIKQDWENLGNILNAEQDLHQQYQQLTEKLQSQKKPTANHQNESNHLKREDILLEMNKLISSQKFDEKKWLNLQDHWKQSNEPSTDELENKFEKTESKIFHKIKSLDQAHKTQQLENLCSELEVLKNNREIKLSIKQNQLRKLKQQFKDLNLHTGNKVPKLREKFSALSQEIGQELGWEVWSGSKRKETLLQDAQKLLEEKPSKDYQHKLKEIQDQWKEVGYTNKSDDEIWEKFKSTCDQVYAKFKEYSQECLQTKQNLLEQLDALKDLTDWKKTTEQIKRIQETWNNLIFIPKKEDKKLEQNYRKICDDFFNKRRDHFKEAKLEQKGNYEKKLLLVEKVKRLGQENDWKSTLPKIKEVQQEWKNLGPVPKQKSETLWKDFNQACNLVYDMKRKDEEVENKVFEEHLKQKLELCEKGEQLILQQDLSAVETELHQLEKEWEKIGQVPKPKFRSTEARFKKVFKGFEQKVQESQASKEKSLEEISDKKSQLCLQVEKLLELEDEDHSGTIETIQQTWNQLGICSQEKALKKKFKFALQNLEQKKFLTSDPSLQKLSSEQLNKLELLCLKLESIAGIEPTNLSPSAKRQWMVAELQAKMGKKDSYKNKREEAHSILREIRLIGPITFSSRETFDSRIKSAEEKIGI